MHPLTSRVPLLGTIYAKGGIPIKYCSTNNEKVLIASSPRESRIFNGREFVLEEALHADVSIVKAWKADTRGNLVFRGTARNANPDAAMSGKICIAEAEKIVPAGELSPDEVHLPGVYVDRVIHAVDN
jgi:acyl CoA:acetate/3-ketoacid CoA transferase alpha subunit